MEYETQYQKDSLLQYECVLFDVDDTLYPKNSGLSAQCTKNIEEYMVQKLGIEENKVSDMNYLLYMDYGTTMAGLRAIGYKFDHDDYHRFVHGRLPYQMLKPDLVLRNLLLSLPIRKVVFSNGDKTHVAKVLSKLGLEDCFEQVICFETLNPAVESNFNDIEGDDKFEGLRQSSRTGTLDNEGYSQDDAGLVPPRSPIVCKPFEDAFSQTFKIADINPQRTLFLDDSVRNIETGKQLGLHTVLVGTAHRTKGADYALESIHNFREALPELWEISKEAETVRYSKKTAIETFVTA